MSIKCKCRAKPHSLPLALLPPCALLPQTPQLQLPVSWFTPPRTEVLFAVGFHTINCHLEKVLGKP